jgi:molecular chaperone GrpE (heat shock protein)
MDPKEEKQIIENAERALEKIDHLCKALDQINDRLNVIQQRLDNMLENTRRMRATLAMTTADNLVTHLRYLRLKYNDLLKPPEDIEYTATSEVKNE